MSSRDGDEDDPTGLEVYDLTAAEMNDHDEPSNATQSDPDSDSDLLNHRYRQNVFHSDEGQDEPASDEYDQGRCDADSDDFYQGLGDHSDEEDYAYFQGSSRASRHKWYTLHLKSQLRKNQIAVARTLITRLQEKVRDKSRQCREQRRKIQALEAENERRKGRGGLRTETVRKIRKSWHVLYISANMFKTWPTELYHYLCGNFHLLSPGIFTYMDIYKLSCRESNIAPHPQQVIPGLEFAAWDEAERLAAPPVNVLQQFNFEGVSPAIQFRILKHVLWFPGQRIHVLSRLDPYHPPALESAVLEEGVPYFELLRRFHIGNEPVILTKATIPSDLLAPLLVCRKFNFWGAFIFYGENEFAFSSLGE
ncbi:hypothetical protein E4U41_002716 [Claviceps citrina]|nr:hypothetical protein E4U41_002716 [Claviceps citrina]